MIYYRPQMFNPDKHPLMPNNYPWIVSSERQTDDDILISESDYDVLLKSIDLSEYEKDVALSNSMTDYLKSTDFSPLKVTVTTPIDNNPFANKSIIKDGVTKKLFKRIHGIQSPLVPGINNIFFTIPYSWCKITGVELVNANNLDKASLQVLDSTAGTYSGYPNLSLNQFGFEINLCDNYYKFESEYDADLFLNMQIKVIITTNTAKIIGINYILNEVK